MSHAIVTVLGNQVREFTLQRQAIGQWQLEIGSNQAFPATGKPSEQLSVPAANFTKAATIEEGHQVG